MSYSKHAIRAVFGRGSKPDKPVRNSREGGNEPTLRQSSLDLARVPDNHRDALDRFHEACDSAAIPAANRDSSSLIGASIRAAFKEVNHG